MNSALIVLLNMLVSTAILTQDWQLTGIDTFDMGDPGRIRIVTAANTAGYAVCSYDVPDYPAQFYLQGDIFFDDPVPAAALYFLFGYADSLGEHLWGAGYSHSDNEIRCFALAPGSGAGSFPELRVLAQKPVEIRDFRPLYVYRIIFLHESGVLQVEVNGVPMKLKSPFDTRKVDRFGYLLIGKAVAVQPFKIQGK